MVTAVKIGGRVAFYVTAFVMGGIIGWASNRFDDWVDENVKIK